MDRKRELKEQYRRMRPEMGILLYRCRETGSVYLWPAQDLRGKQNGVRFQLEMGSYIHRKLQQEWSTYGEQGFDTEVLDRLEYDKDEAKDDYREDLLALAELWREKMRGAEIYR